jgi:glutamyl-tRNA synthetase
LSRSPAAEGGKSAFLLRLEDTDRLRFDKLYVDNVFSSFDWLGFGWDEGPGVGGPYAPYVQSERVGLYKKYADALIEAGKAYYCFCSAEELAAARDAREAAHSGESGYSRVCRSIPPAEASLRAANGEPCVIRLKIPLGETTRFTDALLGDIEWKNDDVNADPVLIKSDGFPTYHLANIVDDHLMKITHVLRAQEWLSSTPLHIILYKALGWEPPVFCHLPMVMGQDGKKLSKRHGATSINEFRSRGYLSGALINYVAQLGASYEEGKDVYTLEELAANFSLSKLNKAPAVFDYKKLEWFNARYIMACSNEELAAQSLPFAVENGLFGEAGDGPSPQQAGLYTSAMPLVKERAVFLTEIPKKLEFLFRDPPLAKLEDFIPKKSDVKTAAFLLKKGVDLIPKICTAGDEEAGALVKAKAEAEGVKLGDLLQPLRVAITGSRVSPPLFGSARLLGVEKCAARANACLEFLVSN